MRMGCMLLCDEHAFMPFCQSGAVPHGTNRIQQSFHSDSGCRLRHWQKYWGLLLMHQRDFANRPWRQELIHLPQSRKCVAVWYWSYSRGSKKMCHLDMRKNRLHNRLSHVSIFWGWWMLVSQNQEPVLVNIYHWITLMNVHEIFLSAKRISFKNLTFLTGWSRFHGSFTKFSVWCWKYRKYHSVDLSSGNYEFHPCSNEGEWFSHFNGESKQSPESLRIKLVGLWGEIWPQILLCLNKTRGEDLRSRVSTVTKIWCFK